MVKRLYTRDEEYHLINRLGVWAESIDEADELFESGDFFTVKEYEPELMYPKNYEVFDSVEEACINQQGDEGLRR